MPRSKTISRQLILNITIPVVLVLVVFSYINYYYNKTQLETLNRERLAQIQNEVQNLIEVYDFGMKMGEIHFEDRMEKISNQLIDLFAGKLDPITTDLYALSEEIGLDTTIENIYIIDTNGVVVNTNFYPDLNLNFYARGEGYREYFEAIWAQNKFFADRFSNEKATGRIKKWSFMPTGDGLFLVELGFLSNEAKQMRDLLHQKVNDIADAHEDIESVFLAMQVKGEAFEGIEDTNLQHIMQEVLVSQKNQRLIKEENGKTIYEDIIYMPVMQEETSMFSGITLYIRSNDVKEQELVSQAIVRFVVMLLISMTVLVLIITVRARSIVNPIKRLTQKAEIISSGKLDERITEEGNNEITTLTRSFNHMVEQLQESYHTLEQKVIDRTAEVVEQKNIAEHQRHLVEEKNKEILDSINYAKRIQSAILPPSRLVSENLERSFILYKPKDIVAGDFYWMEAIDGLVLFAAADCTGHGVPGALVSVVCHNALNRAVKEFGLREPGKILDKTRDIVISEFEKSDNEVKDGMDISLCALNAKTNNLQWAGANNPLWIIRAGETEIIEFKADKQPIGKYLDPKPFTTHSVQLNMGDTFYVFTDGYADQFGGEKGKKFKSSSMKELFCSIQEQHMSLQKETIDQVFENWRGAHEQIDDVSVIGVRV